MSALGLVSFSDIFQESAASIVPVDQGFCAELVVDIDDGLAQVWIDGSLLLEENGTVPPAGGFGRAKIGSAVGEQIMGGPHIFYDDVRVDDRRVGCN